MRIAIQGEKGSNSHMAALEMFGGSKTEILACSLSAEVIRRVVQREVEGALLPIENSLHGSVAEHLDLLLAEPMRVVRESSMRIRHNVLACAGVRLDEVRTVLSHPVALSQCRRWLGEHPEIVAMPFYDTAGSVKHIPRRGCGTRWVSPPRWRRRCMGRRRWWKGSRIIRRTTPGFC